MHLEYLNTLSFVPKYTSLGTKFLQTESDHIFPISVLGMNSKRKKLLQCRGLRLQGSMFIGIKEAETFLREGYAFRTGGHLPWEVKAAI